MAAGFRRLFAALLLCTSFYLIAQQQPSAAKQTDSAAIDAPEVNRQGTALQAALDTLPDAPEPQSSSQGNSSKPGSAQSSDDAKEDARQDAKISASGKLPAILAPQMTHERLSANDKLRIWAHQAFNPVNLIPPAFGAAITMADPPDHYPREWKDGGGAYGRLYADYMARRQSEQLAQFLTQVAVHEDARYLPSESHSAFGRVAHAVGFTLVDRSDSGRKMPAFSNFAGASASGFVGMAYLPSGTYLHTDNATPQVLPIMPPPTRVIPYQYDDLTHAGQRSLMTLGGFAGANIANEFCPEWGPLLLKLHLPFFHPPCAERIAAKRP